MLKKLKKSFITFLLLIIPFNVFAYSKYVIPGGENIGIEISSKGIVVVGTYQIGGVDVAINAGIKKGDVILSVNDKEVNSINEFISSLEGDKISLKIKRGKEIFNTELEIFMDNNIPKTGLYVKDSVTGIGTLSYIDPNTLIFGALGHEVIESNTGQMLDVDGGKIMDSNVTAIDRSERGTPGSKNANLDYSKINGTINENTISGIFGKYTGDITNKSLKKIATPDEIKKGSAKILTVTNGNDVKEYEINILKIDKNTKSNRNILFEVTDQDLLNLTGGIVQGMSGSPIIQNDTIVGAVTHVLVDKPNKGYGIFITNMLEEGEN